MLSQEALEVILGIKTKIAISPLEMADKLNITFYPYEKSPTTPSSVIVFSEKLKKELEALKVNIVPYEKALEKVPVSKRAKRLFAVLGNNILYLVSLFGFSTEKHFISFEALKGILKTERVKPGISIIALGENKPGNLPIEKTSSFRHSSVITILEKPKHIHIGSNFYEHFDTALSLFAYHMTNIIILVDGTTWILYNFNASHPVYSTEKDFREALLYGLIPKVVAPILPYRFSDFSVVESYFDVNDKKHKGLIKDFVESGPLFEKAGLYPPGKKIDDLPFRNDFHRWIGKLHLDHRTGMSYGFLATQMPCALSPLVPFDTNKYGFEIEKEKKDYFWEGEELHIILELPEGVFSMRVPEVWLLSQRSGSDKTNIIPEKDLVKIGLKDGRMYLQTPEGLRVDDSYRPSFDTGVMFAHAVGNAIIASVLAFRNPNDVFAGRCREGGVSLSHWHGYIDPSLIPRGWFVHGADNPHVSCSSPQSAVYAIAGKLHAFEQATKMNEAFLGDIHIEPHHGTNITFTSLKDLASLFLEKKGIATLGNLHLSKYKSHA